MPPCTRPMDNVKAQATGLQSVTGECIMPGLPTFSAGIIIIIVIFIDHMLRYEITNTQEK